MASANLRFRIDGGAVHTGTVSDTPANLAGKTVALSASSYAGWKAPAAKWMIAEYPDGFACPSGWTTDATGIYVYTADPVSGLTPPDFDLPSTGDIDAGQWGKFEFRLLVNGTVYSQKCGIEILSNNGVHDLAFGEEDEFGGPQRQWVEDQKTNLRTFDGALAGGAPVGAKYLIKEANVSLPQATVWTSITTTVDFTSTSTIPCSFNRQQATTNTAVDAMRIESSSSTTAANNFGVACLYRSANKDAGRLKFIFTDITNSSEDTEFIVQVRTAGAALADAFLLSGTTWQVPQLAGNGVGILAVDNSGNITWTAGGSGAPADAPYLTVGAVSGLSAEVDITAVTSTVAFASSTVVPLSVARTDSATDTFVDVAKTTASTSGTAAANFGATHLYRAEDASGSNADIGRHGYIWTNAGALTAESEYIIQLRHAGDGLQTKLTLTGAGLLTVANLTLSGLATGYLYSTAGVVSIGATQPAPSDAPFLTVGPVSGLSAEVDVNAIGTTVVFGSTSTEPCAFRRTDSDTNGIIGVCTFRRASSGTAAAGNGGRLTFEAQDASGGFPVAGYMSWRLTTATAGGEVSELGLWTRTGGGALTKNAYLTGTGDWTVVGTVSGAHITTDGRFDRTTAGTALVGTTTATAITIGKSGVLTTFPGTIEIDNTTAAATSAYGLKLFNTQTTGNRYAPAIWLSSFSGSTQKNIGIELRALGTGRTQLNFLYGDGSSFPSSTAFQYDELDSVYFDNRLVISGIRISSPTAGVKFTGGSAFLSDGSDNLELRSVGTSSGLLNNSGKTTGGTGAAWSVRMTSGTHTAGYSIEFCNNTTRKAAIRFDGSMETPRVIAAPSTPTSSGNAVTFDLQASQNVKHATTENTTVTFSNAVEGMEGYIEFIQGGTGRTVTMPTNGVGVEYSATILALTVTGIVDPTANTRTMLRYYVTGSPNTRVVIDERAVSTIP